MPQSTRVATISQSDLEIHLKKNLEITSGIVDQINQLPTSEPWVILRYNRNSGKWQNAQTFSSFEDADEQFVTLAQNNGVANASRLAVGRNSRLVTD